MMEIYARELNALLYCKKISQLAQSKILAVGGKSTSFSSGKDSFGGLVFFTFQVKKTGEWRGCMKWVWKVCFI